MTRAGQVRLPRSPMAPPFVGVTAGAAEAMGGRAVLFSDHPWADIPLGLHHVALVLAGLGWSVLFVEPPFSPLHLAGGRRRGRAASFGPRPSGRDRISLFAGFTLWPHHNRPGFRSRLVLRHWWRVTVPPAAVALRNSAFFQPDLAMVGSPAQRGLAQAIEPRRLVYRMADDLSLFPSLTPVMKEAALAELTCYDAVACTSDELAATARDCQARQVIAMPNGVDIRFFATARPPSPLLDGIPPPRVIYAGALEGWFDWPLLIQAAKERPGYSFVVVGGPVSMSSDRLPANIRLLGRRPYSEIPGLLQGCDVGIIPFRREESAAAIGAINPIKLWEYLATGLPVVAAPVGVGPSAVNGLLTYTDASAFLALLDEAIARRRRGPPIPKPYDHDWTRIVEQALSDLGLGGSARAAGQRDSSPRGLEP